jgi:hypothetical protein
MVAVSPSRGLTSKTFSSATPRRQNQYSGDSEQNFQLALKEPVHPGEHGDQRQGGQKVLDDRLPPFPY